MFELCNEIAKKNCSQKYLEKSTTCSKRLTRNEYNASQLPISYFIKEGFRLVNTDSKSKNVLVERELLNKKWQGFMKSQHFHLGATLPMVDISYKMLEYDAESYYTSIGLAILVAEKSSFGKRILALENIPVWINLGNSTDLCSTIDIIYEAIRSQQNTAFSFEKGVDFLISAFIATNSIIKNMKIILFSNHLFGNIDTYYEFVQKKFKLFSLDIPSLIFWNLSKTELCDLPSCHNDVLLLSGGSYLPLKYICKNTNSYDMVYKILAHDNYRGVSSYLQDLLKK
jgi:hypothetical protein